jgi:anti-sigma factor RsiW
MMTLAEHRYCKMEILNQDAPFGDCPSDPDGTAEAYVMRKLPQQEAENFRTHIALCEQCHQRMAFHEEYVQAMTAAAASFAGDGALPLKSRAAAS